ncbi:MULTISPECIES: flagellar biosynthesis protein [Pseudomonas]|uniref:Flagellar biosynthesis protein n=1 Tax=Pseudomonas chlororaphis TaxID=587753 RepID=A0AAX3FMD2_9PSED|nr:MULTISPECIES: flagellar biosynthesis protein [Pseudomonas]AZC37311.1 hypothetical protein C4K37_2924 [Pseudomonas chlororaphis subsp. piscium]AZC43859.1 hypothetical protein C4K36_2934 [Pseudomonas chlororaphis subsp. piscium]WDG75716.1 flagellar biosynthesis protein [Pseudomonas chlororaphis]WDH26649.1 flagellar biosynthesis protein [Pseudomonas chlororaphis]WDH74234.1 flagellar biosynthesis protein [Pseudomonas chlororaphis]
MTEVVMKYLKLAGLLLATTTLFGCATSRSVVDIDGPEVASGNGQKVVINVLDERRFEADPRSADIPSLKNGEINDKAITERAIARKRNGYGMGLGDVLLPEGVKVSTLIAKSIGAAYGKAGYQVVPSTEQAPDARTITVHVVEFWSWMSPGAFSVAVNNKSHLKVDTGSASSPVEVKTLKREGMQMITEDDWKLITEAGLQAISESMAKQL